MQRASTDNKQLTRRFFLLFFFLLFFLCFLAIKVKSLTVSLAASKDDSVKIANHLNYTTSNVNQLNNDKDVLIMQVKELTNKLNEGEKDREKNKSMCELLTREKDEMVEKYEKLKTEFDNNEIILRDANNKAEPAISELNKCKINNRELSGNLAAVESEVSANRKTYSDAKASAP